MNRRKIEEKINESEEEMKEMISKAYIIIEQKKK